MSVIIKEVLTKKELKKWIIFPNKLYKNNKYYVPFLFNDEVETFTKTKNPAYEFCETKLFLAYKNNQIVGRIAGIINHAYNEKWHKKAIRFTRFDFIDDYEVSCALFNKVIQWGKEKALCEIMGPIGFTDMDHEGMLIEGFEELNMSITFYNYPYYIKHMEALGLSKDIDWVEYQIKVPNEPDERIQRISEYIQRRHGYYAVFYNDRKKLYNEAYEAFKLIDKEFGKLYGTVPLTDKVIDKAISDYIPLVNLKYICTIKDKNNEIVAFAALVPSIAKALKRSNGKMLPFGIFRMLKALKGRNDTLEMFFIAVDEEHQKRGLTAIIMDEMFKMFHNNHIRLCESGPELETNVAVKSMWKTFDARNHKRRRCWIKTI